MASVVPVYFVWITPELFNFALGVSRVFLLALQGGGGSGACAARHAVAVRRSERPGRGVLLGIATFSKVSNALLFLPLVAWLLWRRRWWRAVAAGVVVCAPVPADCSLANMAISGEWNYQGGDSLPRSSGSSRSRSQRRRSRSACRWAATSRLPESSSTGACSGRTWLTTSATASSAGMPASCRISSPRYSRSSRSCARRGGGPGWQYLVLAAALAQMLFFIINLPYTWIGGGGSVGNRYFMGAYGIFLFLLPPIDADRAAAVPWAIGAPLHRAAGPESVRDVVPPWRRGEARSAPLAAGGADDGERSADQHRRTGEGPRVVRRQPGQNDPGFQIYFLDDNAYGRETDKSFWVKGESQSRVPDQVRAGRPGDSVGGKPLKQLVLTLSPGRSTRRQAHRERPDAAGRPQRRRSGFRSTCDRGFWYQARAYVWVVVGIEQHRLRADLQRRRSATTASSACA